MPKSKKSRKNRKRHHSKRQPIRGHPSSQKNNTTSQASSNTINETPLAKNQEQYNKLIKDCHSNHIEAKTRSAESSAENINKIAYNDLDLTTPVRPRRISEEFKNDSLEATPVNKRRSLNRPNEQSGLWNVTNLNVLFDNHIVSQNSETSIISKRNSEGSKRRSSSSIPKLHSPGKEKPLLMSTATQTVGSDEEHDFTATNVDALQTPQLNKNIILTETHADIHQLNNTPLNNRKHKNLSKFSTNNVNINPYLKRKELDIWTKVSSIEETSFFSPQLFEMKTSSTPIQRHLQENKLLNVLKEGVCENFDTSLSVSNLDNILNNKIMETPASEKVNNRDFEHININTPRSEKVVDKEPSLIMSSSIKAVKKSPKIRKALNRSRVVNSSVSYCRLHASKRSSLERSGSLMTTPPLRLGIYDRLIGRIKKYSRPSAKWSARIMETFAQIGIQIKNSLSSVMCKVESSMLECTVRAQQSMCKCKQYETEIKELNAKIEELETELEGVKKQIEECERERGKNLAIEEMKEQLEKWVLEKVKQQLDQFLDLRKEITSLKEQFKCMQTVPLASIPPPPPPMTLPTSSLPPLPPPPPPPPPPPMMSTPASRPKLGKRSKTTLGIGESQQSQKENDRPVISLDDILKVKLKKPSDRGNSLPSAQPKPNPNKPLQATAVSMEMLKQVKLRPASRTSLLRQELSTPNTDTDRSSGSTSPHSSLCRLLSGDNSVWRVKRLRKVGGYSLDSINRATPRTPPNISPKSRWRTSSNRRTSEATLTSVNEATPSRGDPHLTQTPPNAQNSTVTSVKNHRTPRTSSNAMGTSPKNHRIRRTSSNRGTSLSRHWGREPLRERYCDDRGGRFNGM